jgi:hypothetical protein
VADVAANMKLIDSTSATILPATQTNGTIQFTGVAPGPYLICDTSYTSRHICAYADAAMLDLGYASIGRLGQVLGGPNTMLGLTVTGATTSTSANEFLDVRILNTGFETYPPPPSVGSTTLTTQNFNGRTLLAPADVIRVTQLDKKMSGSDEYVAATKTGSVSNITMTDGLTTPAAVDLGTALTQNNTSTFTLKRATFDTGSGTVGTSPTWRGCDINGWSEADPFGWRVWTFFYPAQDTMSTDKTLTFTYGNPAPTYTQRFELACSHAIPVTAPGATTGSQIVNYAAAYRPIAELTGNVSAAIGRVSAIKVNNMDASTAVTGTTVSPTLSWTAPTLGTATRYTVFLYRAINAATATTLLVPVQFQTNATSLKIPAGYIMAGEGWAATIRSEAISNYDPTKPFAPVLRREAADATTAILQP